MLDLKFRRIPWGSVCLLLAVPLAQSRAARVDGFTEPFRSVEVATTEVGILTEVRVEEGDRVEPGEVLATLDDEVQSALLSIAAKNLELRGRLASARAEFTLRTQRLEKLRSLQRAGHARQEEVERAGADLEIAEAQVLAAEEEIAIRELEYRKSAIQVARRQVTAPIAGVVAVILKEQGEFVAPTDPHILKLVQLDQLLATFSVRTQDLKTLVVGSKAKVVLDGQVVVGVVDRIAPITDAESNTVRIKVRINNAAGKFRSGLPCALLLPSEE